MLLDSYVSRPYIDRERALTYAFGKINAAIIADIDRNGYTDLVTFPSNFTQAVSLRPVVWLNRKGVFTPDNSVIRNTTEFQYFRDSIAGDFNGDGLLDYIQADQGWELENRNPLFFEGNHPALLLGARDGLDWSNKTDWLDPRAAGDKIFNHIGDTADYDDDGDLDLAIAGFADFRLYRNDGTGRFIWQDTDVPTSIEGASGVTFIKLGGQYALAAGYYRDFGGPVPARPISVLAQDQGRFVEAYTLPRPDLGGRELNFGAADMYNLDINGDGREDLLVTWETEPSQGIDDGLSNLSGDPRSPRYADIANTFVSLYLQDTAGRLVPDPSERIYNLHEWTSGAQLQFVDFNGDGNTDFYSTTFGIDIDRFDDLIWLGDGAGGFYRSPRPMFLSRQPLEHFYEPSPFFFDANNDGTIDVVTTRGVFDSDSFFFRNVGEEVRVFLNPPGQVDGARMTGGKRADSLAGTTASDKVEGLAGNDRLDGLAGHDTLDGGKGADTLTGGHGDDVYVVDQRGDTIVEMAGQGTDTIRSTIDTDLSAAPAVEHWVALGKAGVKATGNALSNRMTGNAGHNPISGGAGDDTLNGGHGNDTLTGGEGRDLFVFDTAPGKKNVDRIDDFVSGVDRIGLDSSLYTAFGGNAVQADQIVVAAGTAALASQRGHLLVLDTARALLWHDPDGSGPLKATVVANLVGVDALVASDFVLV